MNLFVVLGNRKAAGRDGGGICGIFDTEEKALVQVRNCQSVMPTPWDYWIEVYVLNNCVEEE